MIKKLNSKIPSMKLKVKKTPKLKRKDIDAKTLSFIEDDCAKNSVAIEPLSIVNRIANLYFENQLDPAVVQQYCGYPKAIVLDIVRAIDQKTSPLNPA